MSFVIAAPDMVSAAATDLENIRSTISAANSAAAGSTTALLPAAEDEVSAAIAALFGAHGTAFQAASAQAAAFHEEFVRVLNAGAGAYLSTELANAQQNLLNAVNAPVQGLLGHSAAASSLAGARTAALSLLGGGGLGSILGTGAPLGHGINGVVTALHNGSAVSLLSGQIGAVPQSLSGGIAGLPTGLTALQRALAPGLLAPAASHGLASVVGPYETLVTNTLANLHTLEQAILANPAPFLRQFLINQIHYAQRILMDAVHFIEDPAATIQAAIHALRSFDPQPFIDAVVAQHQFVVTHLEAASHDFAVGLEAFPAAIQSALQQLAAGNPAGAVSDIAQAFLHLFVTPPYVTFTEMGDPLTPPGLSISITPTGTLGELLPILGVPGTLAHDFAALLPPGSIPADFANNVGNVLSTLGATNINLTALIGLGASGISATATANVGLPVALLIDALGAPVNGVEALAHTGTVFVHDLQTGDLPGALATAFDAPAIVTNAFLNGETTIPLEFPIPPFPPIVLGPLPFGGTLALNNASAEIEIPLDGILVPQTPITAVFDGTASGTGLAGLVAAALVNTQLPLNIDVGGTPISGLAEGLLVFAPEQLAKAITPP